MPSKCSSYRLCRKHSLTLLAHLQVNYYLGNAYLPLKEIYVPSPEAQRPQAPAASGGSAGSSSDEDEDAGEASLRDGQGHVTLVSRAGCCPHEAQATPSLPTLVSHLI